MEDSTKSRLDSKGRVVIPEKIRSRLGLRPGAQFTVIIGDGEEVILRSTSPASMKDFDELTRQARRQARQSGLRKSEVTEAIHRLRGGL
jgi:AbrB family looped-hinge helix DNA binding protein